MTTTYEVLSIYSSSKCADTVVSGSIATETRCTTGKCAAATAFVSLYVHIVGQLRPA